MPTLLDDREFEPVEETLIEEFDLERLARISEPPAIEPPRFALLEGAPRFRRRRTLVLAVLAAGIVSGLATLRPDTDASYAPAPGATYSLGPAFAHAPGSGSQSGSTPGDACAVAD